MTDSKRACIAFVCGLKINALLCGNCVFDYENNKYCYFSHKENANLMIADYSRNNYLQGVLPTLFDFASGTYITLNVKNDSFQGFDYESGHYYTGNMTENNIHIYDYEQSSYYTYRIL